MAEAGEAMSKAITTLMTPSSINFRNKTNPPMSLLPTAAQSLQEKFREEKQFAQLELQGGKMSDRVVLGAVASLLVLMVVVASCLGYQVVQDTDDNSDNYAPYEATVQPSPELAPAPAPAEPASPGGASEELPDTGAPHGI